MKSQLLAGKNALITGARRGIGRAIAERFAENGANVWAHARSRDEGFEADMAALSLKYGTRVSPLYAELRDEASVKAAVQSIVKEKTPIGILVNNAGSSQNTLFQMTSMTSLREQFEVNFFAPFLLTQMVCRVMLKFGGGNVVNIASTAAMDANPGRVAYGASKAALICFTKALAAELGPHVRVNAIAPGIVGTELISDMTAEVIEATVGGQALKKMGAVGDIADAALFLASSESSYITGQVIRVDGGMY
jgi:3-oxoacyl-[acyl-carrier protein] reductase